MIFSERLKELRESTNLTQQDLARVIGVSRATVAGYENLGKQPNFDILIQIAKYFGVSTDYLLGVNDKNTANEKKDIFYKTFDDMFVNENYFGERKFSESWGYLKNFYLLVSKAYNCGMQHALSDTLFKINSSLLGIMDYIEEAVTEYTPTLEVSGTEKAREAAALYFQAHTSKYPQYVQNDVSEFIDYCADSFKEGIILRNRGDN